MKNLSLKFGKFASGAFLLELPPLQTAQDGHVWWS